MTALALGVMLAAGCAAPKPYDYTALRAAKPRSILVLPPLNHAPDVNARASFYAQVARPLAEGGYYVFPVAAVDEMFKQNGLTEAGDIHALAQPKLREIFGADAALYIEITQYGTSFQLFNSVTRVAAKAKLVDLKTTQLLWDGEASATDSGAGSTQQGGLVGALVGALIKHAVAQASDEAHRVAGAAASRLLEPQPSRGLLPGPYRAEAAGRGP